MTATALAQRRRLELGADPRRRRSLLPGDHHRRGYDMTNLGCQITFWPGNTVQPSAELLQSMCIMRSRPPRLPRPANDNLKASA